MRTAPTRAERQARTRAELVDAAERLFTANGFDATSLGAVADAAGFTKGAVYSNFASKEDLFFAVYERRVERYVERAERTIAQAGVVEGMRRIVADVTTRRGHDDGWLTVFLEFWTHVLRHPEHRARFAAIHARAIGAPVGHLERLAADRGVELPVAARQAAVAVFAMQTGLSLERLTPPEVVDAELGQRMFALWLDLLVGERGGAGRANRSLRCSFPLKPSGLVVSKTNGELGNGQPRERRGTDRAPGLSARAGAAGRHGQPSQRRPRRRCRPSSGRRRSARRGGRRADVVGTVPETPR